MNERCRVHSQGLCFTHFGIKQLRELLELCMQIFAVNYKKGLIEVSLTSHTWVIELKNCFHSLCCCCCCQVAPVVSDCVTPQMAAHQAPPSLGTLQARTLESVAISFSNAWKWKVKVKSLSRVRLLATPWTAAYQAPLSMGFSRQGYWSGVPLPSPHSLWEDRKEEWP